MRVRGRAERVGSRALAPSTSRSIPAAMRKRPPTGSRPQLGIGLPNFLFADFNRNFAMDSEVHGRQIAERFRMMQLPAKETASRSRPRAIA